MPPNAKQIKALAGKLASSSTTRKAVLKTGAPTWTGPADKVKEAARAAADSPGRAQINATFQSQKDWEKRDATEARYCIQVKPIKGDGNAWRRYSAAGGPLTMNEARAQSTALTASLGKGKVHFGVGGFKDTFRHPPITSPAHLRTMIRDLESSDPAHEDAMRSPGGRYGQS